MLATGYDRAERQRLSAGTVLGRTTSHMTNSETVELQIITQPIGIALEMPNRPTIGEVSPASPKFTAPIRDAAVAASLP
jgi:hypothetical protein